MEIQTTREKTRATGVLVLITVYLSTSSAAMIQPLQPLVFLLAMLWLLQLLLPVLSMTKYMLAILLEDLVTMLFIMFEHQMNAREDAKIHLAALGSTITVTINIAGLREEKELSNKEQTTMALSPDLLTAK